MRHRLLALVAVALLAVACTTGDDADDGATARPATTGAAASDGSGRSDAFCEALQVVSTSGEAEEVSAAYDQMEASAPPEIEGAVAEFLVSAREISAAFAPLGPNASASAVEAAVAGLSPPARDTLELLTASSQTGTVPPGDEPAAVVLRYGVTTCGLGR